MLCRKLISSGQRGLWLSSITIARNAKTKVIPPNLVESKVAEPQTLVGKVFGKYLLFTNTVSSGLLMVAGDVICQEIELRGGELKERYNYKRICK